MHLEKRAHMTERRRGREGWKDKEVGTLHLRTFLAPIDW